MKEQKLNQYGMTPLTGKHYFVYGLGNFASQLSWTMVSTYLSIFYTDVFGLGTATKVATAIANSLFLVVMGAFGYVGGGEITPHVQTGINLAANLLPGIVFFIGIIPLMMYDLDKPGYMDGVRERLTARDKAKKEAAAE